MLVKTVNILIEKENIPMTMRNKRRSYDLTNGEGEGKERKEKVCSTYMNIPFAIGEVA